MRIAVISDLHANLQAWRAALRDLVEAGADSIVCLGDVVGYGPEPRAVLDGLREATDNIVMGNHEAAVAGRMDLSEFSDPARRLIEWTRAHLDDETVRFLGALPPGIAGHGALFVHAEAADPMRFQYIEDAASARANLEDRAERLVFTGHTHLPGVFVMDPAGGEVVHGAPSLLRLRPGMRYLVNVGSVGEPRDLDPRGAYALFDDEQGTVEFRRFEFDIAGYRHALARTGLDYEPFFLATHRRREFLAGAGAAETGPSAAAAGIPMAPRAMAASRILRPVKGAPAPATAPLQAGTKIISLPPDMPGTSRKAIHAGRRLRSRRALTRAAMGLLFLGLSGLALWEYRRHTTPAASHPDEDAESRAMGTENRSTEDTTPSDQPQPVGQQNVIYTPQKMVETRTLGTGTEMMTMTGKTAGTEMQAAPVPASPQPAPAPTTTVTASLSPAPLPLPPAASLSPAMDGEPAGGGRSLSLATAGEDADRFGLQATLGQSLTNSEFRAHEQAPSPGPVMPTLSRPPSYKLARSSASRMPSGTNRSTGGMQAMGGDRSQTGLTLLPSPAASAAVRGAIWLVCFGRGDPFLAPGGVVWNDMADAFVPPAPAKRAWRDVGGRREIEATMVSVEGPLVATRGGVSGLRLVMFGHIVPDDATDGAWAADGRPASLVIRLSGLRPEARYAIHVLASGNTTKGGRVEEWSVEGAPGPAGRHGSTGTDGPELTAPLVPTADGTLTLAFRFGAGYGSSGINTLGICEVPAKGEGER